MTSEEDCISVLLIEDNPGDARLVQVMLGEVRGFCINIERVERLVQGIARLKAGNIDVVVLDLSLPDSSGYETFLRLHAAYPQVPVVLLTGLGDEDLGVRAVRDGAQDYLPKGMLDGSLLARALRYAVERRRSADALRKSEQLIEKTFSSLIDAVLILDAESLEIVNCNPATSTIFGYPPQELVGRKAVFLLDPSMEALESSNESLRSYGLQYSLLQERVLHRKDGSPFIAECSYMPLEEDSARVRNWLVLVRDITEYKQTQETVRESEERYSLAVRGANDGLWDWSLKKEHIYYSPRWKSMLGYDEGEIGESPSEWFDRIHPEDREMVAVGLTSHLNGHSPHFESEFRMLHRDGSYRWVLVRGLAVRDAAGIAYRMAGSQSDITARKSAEEQLIYDAFHDLLTGLPNRALFMDRLGRTIEHSRRHEDYLFAVLFLDLDQFKVVNDSLGHAAGDQLLVTISQALSGCLRSGDTVARLGGDEFVILLEDLQEESEAIQIVKRIHQRLTIPFLISDHQVFTSFSIGIVMGSLGYTNREDVLRDADIAMYQAKMRGRAQYAVFDTEMCNRAFARLELENDLRIALDKGELEVYYQPIIKLQEDRLAGFEALLRWHHPKRGDIPPYEFIPIAEETGLIQEIGRWVLEKACAQIKEWQLDTGNDTLKMNVNISNRQFNQPDFLEQVQKVLAATGLDPASLNLEITENILMEGSEARVAYLKLLRRLGVGLHIDDFGTGYSSLSYLQRFPIDTLKIDYSFINSLDEIEGNAEIVRTIILLARELGISAIAEGIETRSQLDQLLAMDCKLGQGYFLGKPMNASRISLLLKDPQKHSHLIDLAKDVESLSLIVEK